MNKKGRILVIMTGGTICSESNSQNENVSRASKMGCLLIDNYKKSSSPYASSAEFDVVRLSRDVLSENITLEVWNELLSVFKNCVEKEHVGVIVLHGTDTLAYTSCLLSLMLTKMSIPTCMVSAQLDLTRAETNGYVNFRAAVELIYNGILPNVYVVYRNMKNENDPYDSDGKTYVHLGSRLNQCESYSHSFFSEGAYEIENTENAAYTGVGFNKNPELLSGISTLSGGVLFLTPYACMSYSFFDLKNVKAVVHKTYHSQTVCAGDGLSDTSILNFLNRCRERDIPIVLAPCDDGAYTYSTTGDALRNGAFALSGTTLEMAYIKTLVGISLGKRGRELADFLKEEINFEFIF